MKFQILFQIIGWLLYSFACILDDRFISIILAFALYQISLRIAKKINLNINFYLLSFSFFQIIASIYLITRFISTGHYYGHAFDDYTFLNNLQHLYYGIDLESIQINFWIYFLYPIFLIQSFIVKIDIIDLIVLNWILASFVVCVTAKNFQINTNWKFSVILLSFLSIPFVRDAVIHFYRDISILFFISISYFSTGNLRKKIILFLPAISLRIASISILFLDFLGQRIKKSKNPFLLTAFTFSLVIVIFSFTNFTETVISNGIAYSSDLSRVARISTFASNFDSEGLIEFRRQNRLTTQDASLYQNNFSSIGKRAAVYFINPVTMKNIDEELLNKEKNIVKQNNYYEFIVENLFILLKPFLLPIIFIGIIFAYKTNLRILIIFLIYSLLVLFISMQSRHLVSISFIFIYFAYSGIELIKTKPRLRPLYLSLVFLVSITLFYFNI